MTTLSDTSPIPTTAQQPSWLKRSMASWFGLAILGQLAFVVFIAAYYGVRTVSGDFAAWDDKPLIEGYIDGDIFGNLMFISHIFFAAVITLGGIHQLIPVLRQRWPISHRIVGRVFVGAALFMALNGLWLTWMRPTYLSLISAVSTSINAVLILLFVSIAWWQAANKRYVNHRRWALRGFVVVNGVWFFRIGIMAWLILNGGPVGMNESLSGPADIALSFGSYLLPLVILELYFLAEKSMSSPWRQFALIGLIGGCTVTAVGIFGTVAFMWWPYI